MYFIYSDNTHIFTIISDVAVETFPDFIEQNHCPKVLSNGTICGSANTDLDSEAGFRDQADKIESSSLVVVKYRQRSKPGRQAKTGKLIQNGLGRRLGVQKANVV